MRKPADVFQYEDSTGENIAWLSPSFYIDSANEAIIPTAEELYDDSLDREMNVKNIMYYTRQSLRFDDGFSTNPGSIKASESLDNRGGYVSISRGFL